MGIFSGLFGRNKKQPENSLLNDYQQIQAGALYKIYPILKPGDWIGIEAGCLKQTLIGSAESPKLVVGFGYDAPANFVFLTPKDLEGKDSNAVLQDAYTNLENFPQEFEISETLQRKVLTASGGDFSSEKILSKSHMLKAHHLLQADELLVSIPRRRCMMVTSRQADKELLNMFVALHNHAWEDASYGNAPILNALFIVRDGEIAGMIPLG